MSPGFPPGVAIFIVAFTILNILGCLWLIWWTSRGAAPAPQAGEKAEKTGHVWDGDLEEYNNPMPRWWLGLFVLSVIFALTYLALYPGLGNFPGVKGWSQVDQWESQNRAAQAAFEQQIASFIDLPLEQLARNDEAMRTARNLFAANCSTCHGSDARGARGFPNLTDDDWLWGGTADDIYQSIASGRRGTMPALGTVLGEQGVNEVAAYVLSLSGRTAPQDWIEAGKAHFQALCSACHGPDARGNPALGAPDLTDDVWLHGGDFAAVRETIQNGRDSEMPAHAPLLGESKVRLLAAYVLSLGQRSDAFAGLASEEANTDERNH